jgi:N-carbamoylputrescine amidase
MSRTVRVAAAQLGPSTEDKKEVAGRLERLMGEAAGRGVRMIGFPELCLTQFFPNRLERDNDHWFDELPSPLTARLFGIAQEAGIVVVFPYGERDGISHYNSALVIEADGRILGRYRKTHIPAYFPSKRPGGTGSFERLYFAPGNLGFPVFDTSLGRVGVQICYDRMFPEGSRALGLKGAEVVFFPHNYALYGQEYRGRAWGRLIQARAYENGFFAVVPNKAGTEGPRDNAGRSMVISPLGGDIVAEGSGDGEELVVLDIDLDDVAEARRRLPFWRDRRPEVYGDLVR